VLAAALLLAAVMLILSAASADATFPGQDGKIAFTGDNYRQETSGIFAVAPEGGAQERLGPENAFSPSWSADGRRVIFVRYSGGGEREFTSDIYAMNAAGTGIRNLTKTD
jgi:Tol biopolymer transport system component